VQSGHRAPGWSSEAHGHHGRAAVQPEEAGIGEGNGDAIGNSGGRKISHLGGVLLQGIRPVVRVAAQ
jgi:hypothetical protein